jgi:S1-C subfamily serine protease
VNFLDLIIILAVLAQAIKWARSGFFRGFFSLGGLLVGLLVGLLIASFLVRFFDDPFLRFMAALFLVIITTTSMGAIGKYIGSHLSGFTKKIRLGPADSILGATFSAFITLGAIWLVVSVFSGLPNQAVNRQIRGSEIMQSLNRSLPPAPAVLARLGNYLNPELFPRVFTGPEPRPVEPVAPPDAAELRQALENTEGAVVRLESVACGGFITGTGFLADTDLIVTNAHVVAGTIQPTVVDVRGRHRATPVLFDPELDIAILRVPDIDTEPLSISSEAFERGIKAVTLGFPEGGALEATPAAVLREMRAVGRSIYGTGIAIRQVYELQTDVVSGNSGGPVVLPDGTVIGVIFARSESAGNIGYALTSPSVLPLLAQVRDSQQAVSTGGCVR